MDEAAWDAFRRQSPPDKLSNLIDLIEKAKARRLADPAVTTDDEKG
jgi:hypothetical protein